MPARSPSAAGPRDKLADGARETLSVRPATHHEARKQLFGVHGDVAILGAERAQLDSVLRQPHLDRMEMDGGDDGDHAVAGLKSALDESLQDVQERSIVLVNVNYVLGKNHLTPEVKGTGLINRHLPRRSL